MIRPRGVVSETVSNLRWIHRLRTFAYWDFTGTHHPSLTKRHIQSHLRGASHHASLEYLACEARRQRLLFEARLR